ncbi:MAG: TetR/AcrR family transcriptional regulator [Solirubrobacteraceae bacterium]|nr:TetR/AcrR family transcriptional regulator [Patulibacter sp.]
MAEASPEPKVDGRSLRYADRRQELLRAAMGYVLEHGLADLSMRPLAKALGITHTSLSAHFGSKENLITEILATFRQVSRGGRGAPEPALDEHGRPTLDRYDWWWKQWSQDSFLPAWRLNFEVFGIALQNPGRYTEFLEHVVDDRLDSLRPLLLACGCPPDDVDTVATSAIAHIVGLQADFLATGDRERVDRAHAAYVAYLETQRRSWTSTG